MREIVVISGKGGTGKTSVCASLAHLSQNKVVCDLDVDAPDMHILLDPQIHTREAFVSGNEAVIDRNACRRCGICFKHCRFDAVKKDSDAYGIDPLRCEGCGVCVALCPAKAIAFPEKECGEWYVSDTRFGPFVHAQLYPGQENSGRLVTLLKQQARELAKRQGLDLVICDGSPAWDARSSARSPGRTLPWLWWSPRLRAVTTSSASRPCATTSASRSRSSSTKRISTMRKCRPSPGLPTTGATPSWGPCPLIRR